MINKVICTLLAASFTLGAAAQRTDGTAKSLVKADEELAAGAAKNGEKSAFRSYSAADALVFRPNPVNARNYYASQEQNQHFSAAPAYARVSRSGDWGFTSGPFTAEGTEKTYGEYLSVWKAVNGKWELALDMRTTHNKPLHAETPQFVDPKDYYKPKFNGEKQIAAGRDIIFTTEKTLDATLKSYGMAAFGGFLNADARLVFPGYEPITGKGRIIAFYNSVISKISLKTTAADKAAGGDLAYTYGLATIDYRTDLRESFNYIFIYERQADHNWNLVQQIYTPAER